MAYQRRLLTITGFPDSQIQGREATQSPLEVGVEVGLTDGYGDPDINHDRRRIGKPQINGSNDFRGIRDYGVLLKIGD